MIFEPGTLVGGRYRLINRIARGERDEVWRAADRVPERQVVIRRIAAAADGAGLARYLATASRLIPIRNPSLARVYSVGRLDDGDGWIASELLIAERLDELLERRGRMLPGAAVGLVSELARAVAAAHAAGVVHGDLCARSVLLHRDGWGQIVPKLVDFGRVHVDPSGVGYESPERLSNRRSEMPGDVFALGVLLFRSVTGRLPFGAADPLCRLVETYSFDRVLREESSLDEGLRELLGEVLRPERTQRPTASVLADRTQLLAWLTQGGPRDLAKMVRITEAIWCDPAATGVIAHCATIPGCAGPPLADDEPLTAVESEPEVHLQPEPDPEPEPEWEPQPEPEPEPEAVWEPPPREESVPEVVSYVTPTPDDVFVDFAPRRRRWMPVLAAAGLAAGAIALVVPSTPHRRTLGVVAAARPLVRAQAAAPGSAKSAALPIASVTPQRAIVHRKPRKPTPAAATAHAEPASDRGAPIGNVSGIPLLDPKPRDDNPYE